MTDDRPAQGGTARVKHDCLVCGKALSARALRPFEGVRGGVSQLIAQDHPDWGPGKYICASDLARYRAAYVEDLLTEERGELTALDRDVIESFEKRSVIARPPGEVEDQPETVGERTADLVAAFGGSWTFIIAFLVILTIWMTVNVVGLLRQPFDPYPFILLNLVLSCIAALQAPVIMMSQRRQEVKDRARAENDYRVNLKAELEIRQLHEKLDHQLGRQWEKLTELQQIQIDLLEDAARKGRSHER